MKKIFMICYGGGHVQIINEIYRNLADIPKIEIVILSLTTSSSELKKENIPYKTILDYYDEKDERNIYDLGKKFCKENNVDISIGEDETYLYHGYGLFELREKYGKEKADMGFKKMGRKVFLPLLFMRRVLESEKPDLVIGTNSPRYERAALIAAKRMNIRTLSVEDLFGVKDETVTTEMASFFEDEIYEEIYGEFLCVISEESKKNLIQDKVNKVFVTGNPSFDKTLRAFLKQQNNKQFDNLKKTKTLCFLSQNHSEKFLLLNKIIEIIEEKGYTLIVKIHPNEKKEEYIEKVEGKLGNIIIEDSDLYGNILKSDVIITIDSTSSLEAVILGKTVIGKKNKFIPFEKMGIGVEYSDIDELNDLIEKALYDKKFIEVLKTGRDKFRPQKFAGKKIKDIIIKKIL